MTKGTLEAVGADKLAASAPLRRIGDQDDLKGAAVLFASDAGKTHHGTDTCHRRRSTAVLQAA